MAGDLGEETPTTRSRRFAKQALNEKIFLAEKRLIVLRLILIVINTAIYTLLMNKALTMPRLAYSIIGISWIYALYVYLVEPYRQFPLLLSSYFTSVTDAALIVVWIYATGGTSSPFFPLLYVSLIAVAFRFPPRETLAAAGIYSAGYLTLVFLMARDAPTTDQIVTMLCYIFMTAVLGAVISREVLSLTAKKATLEERLKADQTIEKSRQQLAEAQQLAHVGSWERTLGEDEMIWSEELYRIIGLSRNDKPTYASYLSRIHPDDRVRAGEILDDVDVRGESHPYEHRLIRTSGEVRWVSCRVRVDFSEDGFRTRVVGTLQDITERRQIEERLLISDRMASLGTLAGSVAHEINNPLMYVVGNLDFVEHQLSRGRQAADPVPELQQALRDARQGANRVHRIVQDLRLFSRPDSEERVAVDLSRVLEMSINMTSNEVRSRARLVREISQTPPVLGDEARLGQVFVNLLLNAAQSIEGPADKNSITVRAHLINDGQVVVEVRDTGAGIPLHHRSRIFEPFFTTKPAGTGTGLGLSICQGIIRRLGGRIEFESRDGRGTIFRVWLPAVVAATAREGAPSSAA